MKDIHKALLDIVKSNLYPNDVRADAAEGLGFNADPEVQKELIDVARSNMYPNDVRAAASKSAGHAGSLTRTTPPAR